MCVLNESVCQFVPVYMILYWCVCIHFRDILYFYVSLCACYLSVCDNVFMYSVSQKFGHTYSFQQPFALMTALHSLGILSTSFISNAFPTVLKEFPHILSTCWLLFLHSAVQLIPNHLNWVEVG